MIEFRVVDIENIQSRRYWSKIEALANTASFFGTLCTKTQGLSKIQEIFFIFQNLGKVLPIPLHPPL